MPIRFRCVHCNQLMGIARRKAGTAVRCTQCRQEVTVPDTPDDGEPSPAPASPAAGPAEPVTARSAASDVFERDDFEAILRAAPAAPAPPARLPAPEHRPAPPPQPSLSLELSGRLSPAGGTVPMGVVLSPGRATALTVAVILMLAAAFSAGLLVGRFAL